jgi:outer membrane protein assembly factor BamB
LVAGGSVFAVTDEGQLVRLDAGGGETIWSVPLGQFTTDRARRQRDVTAHYGPYAVSGRLLVLSSDGTARFLAPDSGAELGRFAIPGGVAVPPALAGGALFVVSGNGQLHAFR